MSKKCRSYSKSKLAFAPADNRTAFYAGWDAALRERLAQPEQEPVFELGFGWLDDATKYPRGTKLYASPSRKWQSLTAREIENLWRYTYPYHDHQDFARAIEAKLKEKNNG